MLALCLLRSGVDISDLYMRILPLGVGSHLFENAVESCINAAPPSSILLIMLRGDKTNDLPNESAFRSAKTNQLQDLPAQRLAIHTVIAKADAFVCNTPLLKICL
jgi:hypothetical protein